MMKTKLAILAGTVTALAAATAYAQESVEMAEDMTEGMEMEAEMEMAEAEAAPALDVTIDTVGGLGVQFMEGSPLSVITKFDVKFTASGTTDGGLKFGGSILIDGADGGSVVGSPSVSVGTDVWTVSAGDLSPATNIARKLPDIGFGDGIGVDGVAEAAAATAADIQLGLTLGGATLNMTYGNKHTEEVKPLTDTFTPAARTGRVRIGWDIRVMNPSYIEDEDERIIVTGTTNADAQAAQKAFQGIEYLGYKTAIPQTLIDALSPDAARGDSATARQTRLGALLTAANGVGSIDGTTNKFVATTTPSLLLPDNVDDNTDTQVFRSRDGAREAIKMIDCNFDGKTHASEDGETAKGKALEADMMACKTEAVYDVAAEIPAGDPVTITVVEAVAEDDVEEWAIGIGFAAGGVDIGVGYDSNKLVNMGVASTLGNITSALYYEKPKDAMGANMGVNVGMSVAEGTTVSVGFSRGYDTNNMSQNAVGVGMSHDLGGGASFQFGAGRVGGSTAANAGIAMTF